MALFHSALNSGSSLSMTIGLKAEVVIVRYDWLFFYKIANHITLLQLPLFSLRSKNFATAVCVTSRHVRKRKDGRRSTEDSYVNRI